MSCKDVQVEFSQSPEPNDGLGLGRDKWRVGLCPVAHLNIIPVSYIPVTCIFVTKSTLGKEFSSPDYASFSLTSLYNMKSRTAYNKNQISIKKIFPFPKFCLIPGNPNLYIGLVWFAFILIGSGTCLLFVPGTFNEGRLVLGRQSRSKLGRVQWPK